jgi:hypothetical protein
MPTNSSSTSSVYPLFVPKSLDTPPNDFNDIKELIKQEFVRHFPDNSEPPISGHERSDQDMKPLNQGDYYNSQMTRTKCGKIPPAPPGADIDSNIKEAAQHWNPFWFYNQVDDFRPWDYKRQDRLYEDFGNFNYGATGSAFGFPDSVLLRAAGVKSLLDHGIQQRFGTPWGNPPYGDDPNDQAQMRKGIAYYQCLRS